MLNGAITATLKRAIRRPITPVLSGVIRMQINLRLSMTLAGGLSAQLKRQRMDRCRAAELGTGQSRSSWSLSATPYAAARARRWSTSSAGADEVTLSAAAQRSTSIVRTISSANDAVAATT